MNMLIFSTFLKINEKMTKDEFIKLVIEWNQNSPHSINVIPGIVWNGERTVRYGNDKLWLDIKEYRNQNIIAVRYEKVGDDGVVWDTDYVMNFNDMKMSILLDRSFSEEALMTSKEFSAPYFIYCLIKGGYVEDDGNLEVSAEPLYLEGDNYHIMDEVIEGKVKYRLPIVYVSKTTEGQEPIDVKTLAYRLKGAAHVLVEKDLSDEEKASKKYEKNGNVGVYYSKAAGGSITFAYSNKYALADILFIKVLNNVIQTANLQKIDRLYTWQGVNNALLMDRLDSQRQERIKAESEREKAESERLKAQSEKEQAVKERKLAESEREQAQNEKELAEKARKRAETEKENVYEELDEEISEYSDKIAELSNEIDRLLNENYGLRRKLQSVEQSPLLFYGNESDFYPNEIKEMILATLEEACKNDKKRQRRNDIINDLMEANNYERLMEKRKNQIKDILKGTKDLGEGGAKQALKKMGFDVTDDHKHYHLTFQGDDRYKESIAKTGSDHRGGKNTAADILNTMQ
ncbi:MAG: hypothetical protein IJ336_10705 [Lachnospiraceae bacterium]|nr:hypothetical protein [Lachnospiraceae bacterium]